jgi:haloalkane dehalogenase
MQDQDISAEFPYEPQYLSVLGSKMHYIEAGSGEPILFIHGNPTWSYLWRNVIPHLSSGARCIALDLIGMGKSDKPRIGYRFFDHVPYVDAFVEQLGLRNLTMIVHDWGSGLGFHYARRHEGNVRAIAFMEAIVKPFTWDLFPARDQIAFREFRDPDRGWQLIVEENVFIEEILRRDIVRDLSEAEMDAYRRPFMDQEHRIPIWKWPLEIPMEGEPEDVVEAVAAYSEWLQRSEIPKLLFHVQPGAILTPPILRWCEMNLPNLTSIFLGKGYHYIQEDYPHEIGESLARWYKRQVLDDV